MKLSKTTVDILKNFNIINPSIYFRGGNVISTISVADTVLANATIVEEFDEPFGIYDLGFFLNTISLFNDPDLDFSNNGYVVITDEESKATCEFKFADISVIHASPRDSIDLRDQCLSFDISKANIKSLLKASSVMSLKDVKIHKHNNKITLSVFDRQNPLSNNFMIELGEYTEDHDFELYFCLDNLKFVDGDYHIDITMVNDITMDNETNFAFFQNEDIPVNYWIALETDSVFK